MVCWFKLAWKIGCKNTLGRDISSSISGTDDSVRLRSRDAEVYNQSCFCHQPTEKLRSYRASSEPLNNVSFLFRIAKLFLQKIEWLIDISQLPGYFKLVEKVWFMFNQLMFLACWPDREDRLFHISVTDVVLTGFRTERTVKGLMYVSQSVLIGRPLLIGRVEGEAQRLDARKNTVQFTYLLKP